MALGSEMPIENDGTVDVGEAVDSSSPALTAAVLTLSSADVHAELDEGGVDRVDASPHAGRCSAVATHCRRWSAATPRRPRSSRRAVVVLDLELVLAAVQALAGRRCVRSSSPCSSPARGSRTPSLHRRRQHERLERRTDLGTGLVGVVGEVLGRVLTAVDGHDRAVFGFDRGAAELDVRVRVRALLRA